MTTPAKQYRVKFVNHVYEDEPDGEPIVTKFTAEDPEDVKAVIAALSAYYSGDPCECFINGQIAVLENDWGLMQPKGVVA